jgi:hypothetical protein
MKILIVDDYALFGAGLRSLLTCIGHNSTDTIRIATSRTSWTACPLNLPGASTNCCRISGSHRLPTTARYREFRSRQPYPLYQRECGSPSCGCPKCMIATKQDLSPLSSRSRAKKVCPLRSAMGRTAGLRCSGLTCLPYIGWRLKSRPPEQRITPLLKKGFRFATSPKPSGGD